MKSLNDWILLDQHPVSPTPLMPAPERIRAGNPSQTLWNHYSDPSQQFHVGFWACEPGDQFVIPAGFVGEWETLTPCRKLYVIFEPAAT